jgi:uncharacterized protein YciI
MYAVCIMHYAPDRDLVDSVRPRHRTYVGPLLTNGTVVVAGSFEPPDTGAIFLYSVGDRAEAERVVAGDPFVAEGAAKVAELHLYETHGVRPDLLHVTQS